LLVEDVRVSAKLAKGQLERARYKVTHAENGLNAIEQFKQYHSSLEIILMDIGMPGIDGVEATSRIRKIEESEGYDPVTILGLTGNVGETYLTRYVDCGMNGCIVKGKLLVDALKKALSALEDDPDKFIADT